MVEEIEELVMDLNLEGPFIIVSHGMGSLITRLWARKSPELIKSWLDIDGSSELLKQSLYQASMSVYNLLMSDDCG